MSETARHQFGFSFVVLARHWRRRVDRELAAVGLTDAIWTPLIHLTHGGDNISQSELAERVGLDGSSLVRLIDLLEGRGLIERRVDPSDRRARRIVLTEAGRIEVAQILSRLHSIEEEMLADLDDTLVEQMLSAFSQIEKRIRDADQKDRTE